MRHSQIQRINAERIARGERAATLEEIAKAEAMVNGNIHTSQHQGLAPSYKTPQFNRSIEKRYNIAEALETIDSNRPPTGLYKEVTQELSRIYSYKPMGILVPDFCFRRYSRSERFNS
jgi:hypothetical protein